MFKNKHCNNCKTTTLVDTHCPVHKAVDEYADIK